MWSQWFTLAEDKRKDQPHGDQLLSEAVEACGSIECYGKQMHLASLVSVLSPGGRGCAGKYPQSVGTLRPILIPPMSIDWDCHRPCHR